MGHEAVLAAAQKATTEAETARHNKVSEQTQADRPETRTVQTGKVGSCTLIRRWGTRRKFLTQGIQYKFVVTSTGGRNCSTGTLQYTQDNVALGNSFLVALRTSSTLELIHSEAGHRRCRRVSTRHSARVGHQEGAGSPNKRRTPCNAKIFSKDQGKSQSVEQCPTVSKKLTNQAILGFCLRRV